MRLALVLALIVPSVHAQTILVVDDDGPASFPDLQPAYDAASPGDVIRVKAGNYSQLAMTGKGLTIVADEPGCVVDGPLVVTQTLEPLLVRGLRVEPNPQDVARSILFVDTPAAPVWIEDVRPPDDATSLGTMTVFHDATQGIPPVRTTLIRCSNRSAVTAPTDGPSGQQFARSGLLASGQLNVLDCELHGWRGADATLQLPGEPGGAGLWQTFPPTSDSLFVSGSRLFGADGGAGFDDGVNDTQGGDGGPGLMNFGAVQGTGAFLKDSELLGGLGAAAAGGSPAAADGLPLDAPAGNDPLVTQLPQLYREFRIVPGAVTGDYVFDFRSGQAGSICFWTPAAVPNPILVPSIGGVIVPRTFVPLTQAGITDANGDYSFTLSAGPLAFSGITRYLQAAYLLFDPVSGQPSFELGSPTSVVLLP